jgi:hypothetical protein
MNETDKEKLIYNEIPKQVTRKDFNKYINPHLTKPMKGPKPKISFYKIFNYILYVLHTGIQWNQLKTKMKYIGQMFIEGIIIGLKMAHIRSYCLLLSLS